MSETFPAIPDASADVESLRRTVKALKEAVEMLTGQRGTDASTIVSASEYAQALALLRSDAVNGLASKVAKGGDIMTGLLTLSGDPSTALQAVPKQYADAGDIWVKIADPLMPTGANFVDVSWTAGAYRAVQLLLAGAQLNATTGAGMFVRVFRDGVLADGASDYVWSGNSANSVFNGTAGVGNIWPGHFNGILVNTQVSARVLVMQDGTATRTITYEFTGYAVNGAGNQYATFLAGEMIRSGTGALSGVRFGMTDASTWARGRLTVLGLKA